MDRDARGPVRATAAGNAVGGPFPVAVVAVGLAEGVEHVRTGQAGVVLEARLRGRLRQAVEGEVAVVDLRVRRGPVLHTARAVVLDLVKLVA